MVGGRAERQESVVRKIVVGPMVPNRGINLKEMAENPGLSGTEFSQILAAHYLQEVLPSYRVELASIGFPISLGKLRSTVSGSLSNFFVRDAVLIVSVEQLLALRSDQVANALIVVVSHHPHDQGLKILRKRFKLFAVIHVSRYSFWSNFSSVDRMVFIPNLLPMSALCTLRNERVVQPGLVCYLGALVPSKRFLDLARAWPSVVAKDSSARLEVVGSASLYGADDGHAELPTSEEYGDAILSAFGVESITEIPSVSFLGNVTENKGAVTDRWQMAVVNPSGNTESFCYSFRELVASGIPTIGGVRQGMSDVMVNFTGLAVRRADLVGPRILHVLGENFNLARFEKERQDFIQVSIKEQTAARVKLAELAVFAAHACGRGRELPIALPPLMSLSLVRALFLERNLRSYPVVMRLRDWAYIRFIKRFQY